MAWYAFTAILHVLTFFTTNLPFGERKTTKALLVQAVFAVFAGGGDRGHLTVSAEGKTCVGYRSVTGLYANWRFLLEECRSFRSAA